MLPLNPAGVQPLGAGQFYPAAGLADPELLQMFRGYKRGVAGSYRAVMHEELPETLPRGELLVSPKIDGELWFLILDGGQVALASPRGKVVTGKIPVLEEAAAALGKVQGRTVIAGEFYVAKKSTDRPRVGDLASLLSSGPQAEVGALAFCAFDVVTGGDAQTPGPIPIYADRLALLQRLFTGGKRLKDVKTEKLHSVDEVQALFTSWVTSGKAEGLVIRSSDGRIFKLKPSITIDAAIIAYTQRREDAAQIRSLLLAVLRNDDKFQVIGSCGNMGSEDDRRAMMQRLAGTESNSAYRHASSDGALYQFVKPTMVVEIKASDLQSEDSAGNPVDQMVLEFGGETWRALHWMPGANMIHPILNRIRDDKSINPVDIRASQVLERVYVESLNATVEKTNLAPSQILRREVYTKDSKGALAVRKLLVWKTNKEQADPLYSAYVVHWTDYSAGRADPLQREVRLAPSEEVAMKIAEEMIVENVKKGWERAAGLKPSAVVSAPSTTVAQQEAPCPPPPEAAPAGAPPEAKAPKKAAKKSAAKVVAPPPPDIPTAAAPESPGDAPPVTAVELASAKKPRKKAAAAPAEVPDPGTEVPMAQKKKVSRKKAT